MNNPLRACAKWSVVALICIANAFSGLPVASQIRSAGMPNLGDGEDLSLAAEKRLGQSIAREIYRDPDYLDDPVLGDYLQSIWQPLLAASRARGELSPEMDATFAWAPLLIRDRTVNAFALPGGYMGVNLGLISLVVSRDELASVLGHEMSHITQRHIARAVSKQARQTPLMLAAILLGLLAASKSPDAANATVAGSMAVAQQNQLNFSRDMEREADRIGFSVMTGAGFDGHAFVTMFDKLDRANRINDNGSFPYLRTHPLTTERIADAQLRLSEPLERIAPPVPASAEPLMMGARARVLADPGVDALRAMVSEATSADSALRLQAQPMERRAGVLYGAIMAKLRLKDNTDLPRMLAELAALTAQDPQAARASTLLAAEVALAMGDPARTLALLTPLDGPTASRAAMLLGVQARTQLGDPASLAQAAGSLELEVAQHPQDAFAWQLLAGIYGRQGLPARAIRAEAESRVAELDYGGALDRFKAAQAISRSQAASGPGDNIEASILDTRTRQVTLLLREQTLER